MGQLKKHLIRMKAKWGSKGGKPASPNAVLSRVAPQTTEMLNRETNVISLFDEFCDVIIVRNITKGGYYGEGY